MRIEEKIQQRRRNIIVSIAYDIKSSGMHTIGNIINACDSKPFVIMGEEGLLAANVGFRMSEPCNLTISMEMGLFIDVLFDGLGIVVRTFGACSNGLITLQAIKPFVPIVMSSRHETKGCPVESIR